MNYFIPCSINPFIIAIDILPAPMKPILHFFVSILIPGKSTILINWILKILNNKYGFKNIQKKKIREPKKMFLINDVFVKDVLIDML